MCHNTNANIFEMNGVLGKLRVRVHMFFAIAIPQKSPLHLNYILQAIHHNCPLYRCILVKSYIFGFAIRIVVINRIL